MIKLYLSILKRTIVCDRDWIYNKSNLIFFYLFLRNIMPESITIDNANINDVISFINYGTAIIPNITDGTLIGLSSGDSLRDPFAAATNHANIYPALPNLPEDPTPNDYTKYNYFVIRKTDTTIVEIGLPWIIPSSMVRLLRKTALVTIQDFDEGQLANLNEVLLVNGFLDFNITIS